MSQETILSLGECKKLTKKLKNEDPEQFQTLVRMHLSFVLDLNIDDTDGNAEKTKFRSLKWGFTPFSKKTRCPEKIVPEVAPLTQQIISQVFHLIKFLSKEENLLQEGIFRRSGKVTRQQELKALLAQGITLELDEGQFSVHDCASVLKSFLSELPEPLLLEVYYPAYCQIAELCQTESGTGRLLHALQLLLLLLPPDNRKLMKGLLQLLNLTASHEESNRMSAENLATLFTPHLLCPRKLSPEAFHASAQNCTRVVVFMIKEGLEVFEIPQTLATDIKAYWDRRRRTPDHLLERSLTEGSAAKTVFSFVDRERTAQEHTDNPTETALAQLYAHIQGLPESNKKKRLIKQFNKENGHGTPRTKTLSDSIKKHIFHKSHKGKAFTDTGQLKLFGSATDYVFSSPGYKTPLTSKGKLKFDTQEREKVCGRMPSLKASLGSRLICGNDEEESPPKMIRVSPPEPGPESQGSHDHTPKSETSGCVVWFESMSLGQHIMDCEGDVLGRIGNSSKQETISKLRVPRGRIGRIADESFQGLSVQSERADGQPCRPELFESHRRFRPVVFRRQASKRFAPVLSRPREPSILDEEFWVSPESEEGQGSANSGPSTPRQKAFLGV